MSGLLSYFSDVMNSCSRNPLEGHGGSSTDRQFFVFFFFIFVAPSHRDSLQYVYMSGSGEPSDGSSSWWPKNAIFDIGFVSTLSCFKVVGLHIVTFSRNCHILKRSVLFCREEFTRVAHVSTRWGSFTQCVCVSILSVLTLCVTRMCNLFAFRIRFDFT